MFLKLDFLTQAIKAEPLVKKLTNAENNDFTGVTFFKENLLRGEPSTFELPVNNFLKDRSEMNQEFRHARKHEFSLCLDGRMVTATEILNMRMEENY